MANQQHNDLPNWQERYNARFIYTLRVRVLDAPGMLARLLNGVGDAGASVGDIRIVDADSTHKVRDIQVFFVDETRRDAVVAVLNSMADVELLAVIDEVLEIHRRGTIETCSRVRLESVMDLRMVYTPGVARVCELIHSDPAKAWDFTAIGNKIAIATNGTAVLGLGDIGPLASLPVMEGKAAILARFVGVSAEPVLVESRSSDEFVDTIARIASGYGAIQLEDIAAPQCFEIERRLQDLLNIPVFHDDQHGTATVAIAGLINALKVVKRTPGECRAVILGAGAAGSAIAHFLIRFGVPDVVVCDSVGAIHRERSKRMNAWKQQLADETNTGNVSGSLDDVIRDRNLFIGVSKPNVVSKEMISSMGRDAIVFALANPVSEIPVSDALDAGAAVAIDGRGMNNALAYPGIFRGALDARAKAITFEMQLAAAQSLARSANGGLLPDMLDQHVHEDVALAVRNAASSL